MKKSFIIFFKEMISSFLYANRDDLKNRNKLMIGKRIVIIKEFKFLRRGTISKAQKEKLALDKVRHLRVRRY